jgi:hypothetical protein
VGERGLGDGAPRAVRQDASGVAGGPQASSHVATVGMLLVLLALTAFSIAVAVPADRLVDWHAAGIQAAAETAGRAAEHAAQHAGGRAGSAVDLPPQARGGSVEMSVDA